MPSAAGGSWDCCAELESPHQDAAAAGASGGCSEEACLATSVAVVAPHHLHQPHFAAVAPVLVHLVLAEVGVLLVLQCLLLALHPVLDAHPLNSAAAVAASASDAGAFAGGLQLLVTWSWGSPAAGLAVLAHLVVLLAVGDPLHLHLQAGVGKREASLVVPGQAA